MFCKKLRKFSLIHVNFTGSRPVKLNISAWARPN